MAEFQEEGDWKLQISYLHVGITTYSIIIGRYSWYCFIYRNKNLACQWHFNPVLSALLGLQYVHAFQAILLGYPLGREVL